MNLQNKATILVIIVFILFGTYSSLSADAWSHASAESFKSRATELVELESTYLIEKMNGCLYGRPAASPLAMPSWVDDVVVGETIESYHVACARRVVSDANTLAEARERNRMLGKLGLSPLH